MAGMTVKLTANVIQRIAPAAELTLSCPSIYAPVA